MSPAKNVALTARDQWLVRRGSSRVGPVATELLLRGIRQGKIPHDAELRREGEDRWMPLMEVVVAVASASLDDPDMRDLSDEARTIVGESPLHASSPPKVERPIPSTAEAPGWYVQHGNSDVFGPVATDFVIQGITSGRLPLTTFVQPLDNTGWVPVTAHPMFQEAARKIARPDPAAPPPSAVAPPPPAGAATSPMRSSSLVALYVPGSPQPPVQMTLAQVRVALLQGRIPSTAVMQVVSNGDWLPAPQVIAECIDFLPTRAGGAMALLIAMPVALLIVLRVLFGSAGGLWTIVLLVAGIAGQAFISMTPALRTRSTRALFKKRSFQLAAGGTLLACLAPAVTLGLIDRSKHARIQSALASANPCDIATVVDVLATDGTDEEKSAAPAKQSACDEALSRKACDLLISHLDGNAVSPEDLAWLKAHGEPKDSDVVSSLSTHALTDSSDLLLSQSDLGCSGRIWDRLVKTLAVTPVVWVKATAASDDMKVSIVAAGLSPEAQAALGANAERLALSVDTRTPSDEMKGAAAMCELCGALKVATGRGCATVTARYAKVVAREQGAEAAASAAAAESAAADFRAGMQAQQGRIASCRAQISTVISLCKVNCHEKYGSFDPGPARDDLINKCESGCYDVAPSFDSCK